MNKFQQIQESLESTEELLVSSARAEIEPTKLFNEHLSAMGEALVEEKFANIKHRTDYVKGIYQLVSVWLGAMLLLIIAEGITYIKFDLHKDILIAIITTTTIPIVALLGFVVRYLFKQ